MFGCPFVCVCVLVCRCQPSTYVCVSVQIEFDLLKFDIFRDTSAANQANMSKKKCTEGKCCIICQDLNSTINGSYPKKIFDILYKKLSINNGYFIRRKTVNILFQK